MKVLDNLNTLWGDDLKQELKTGAKLKIAASMIPKITISPHASSTTQEI